MEFVATNIKSTAGNSPFVPYVVKKVAGSEVVILGVTTPPKAPKPGWEVLSPEESLSSVLSTIDSANKIVVLISDLPRERSLKLLKSFPIHVLFLSGEGEDTSGVNQMAASKLWMGVRTRGQMVGRIDLNPKLPVLNFFNASVSTGEKAAEEATLAKLDEATQQLKSKNLAKKKRKYLEAVRRNLLESAKLSEAIPAAASEQTSLFAGRGVFLDKPYQLPTNEMTEIMDRYKKTIEKAAENGDF